METRDDSNGSLAPVRGAAVLSLRAPTLSQRPRNTHRPRPSQPAREGAQTRPRDALSCVRHDLRCALHAVVGFTGLLASESYGPLNEDQLGFLEHIQVSSERLEALTDALGELSRGAAALPMDSLLPFQVGPILRQTLFALSAEHGYLAADIQVDPELEDRRVRIDAGLLRASFSELTSALTRQYTVGLRLTATRRGPEAQVRLVAMGRPDRPLWVVPDAPVLISVDQLGDHVDNRAFLSLKLAETYLLRLGARFSVGPSADLAEVTLPLWLNPDHPST